MAFVKIASWEPEEVAEWLRGLDDIVLPYVTSFLDEQIDGKQLLALTHYDLEKLGVRKLGHQELILEAVDLLCALHYGLESENIQSLALKLSCKAKSLHNEIRARRPHNGVISDTQHSKVSLYILNGVAQVALAVKDIVSWLDRPPFDINETYSKKRNLILRYGTEMTTACYGTDTIQRSEEMIMRTALELSEMCDCIIREAKDPLVIQPASLELATIRKKPDEELGMHIQSSYNGTHTIGGIKKESPADMCGKIEEGDEVIQVNYQTVVGWQLKKLVTVLKKNQKEVTLTLKKRPRHTSLLGAHQKRKISSKLGPSTFPKALRRNSRESKKSNRTPLQEFISSVPSTSGDASHVNQAQSVPVSPASLGRGGFYSSRETDSTETDNDTSYDNDVFRSGSESPGPFLLDSKQRRATVSGGSPTLVKRPSLKISDLSPVRPKSHTFSSPSSEDSKSLGSPEQESSDPAVHSAPDPIQWREPLDDRCKDSSSSLEGATSMSPPPPHKQLTVPGPLPTLPKPSDYKPPMMESPKRKRASEMASKEIAGSNGRLEPQLLRMIRISSTRRQPVSDLVDLEEHDDWLPELNHMEKRDKEADHHGSSLSIDSTSSDMSSMSSDSKSAQTSYTVNVIGGVAQKVPNVSKESPSQSPAILRGKKITRRMGNRRISCKDLGHGDCQGWLWKKKEGGGNKLTTTKWVKRWFILKKHNMYYYKDTSDVKAQGVIHLPGFQVSPAPEIKSKKFAFKAHHPGTTFYFASDRQDDMGKWMNKMGLAAIVYDQTQLHTTPGFKTGYYSESDDESSPGSPETRRESASSEATDGDHFSSVYKSIRNADLDLDGSDKKLRRKSTLVKPKKTNRNSTEVLMVRKLSSLQRTLKDKENELAKINELLDTGPITPDRLKEFQGSNPEVFRKKDSSEA